MNTSKEQKLKALQEQLEWLQDEIKELNKPETMYVVVTNKEDYNWYSVGDIYKVFTGHDAADGARYYPLVSNKHAGVNIWHCVMITDKKAIAALDATDIQERN